MAKFFFSFLSFVFLAIFSHISALTIYAQDLGPKPAGINQLKDLFLRIINLSVGLAFVAVTAMIVIAAFKFLTSGGDQKKLESAKQTITWAVFGILFLAGAWIALRLISAFIGVDLTCFDISFNGADCN